MDAKGTCTLSSLEMSSISMVVTGGRRANEASMYTSCRTSSFSRSIQAGSILTVAGIYLSRMSCAKVRILPSSGVGLAKYRATYWVPQSTLVYMTIRSSFVWGRGRGLLRLEEGEDGWVNGQCWVRRCFFHPVHGVSMCGENLVEVAYLRSGYGEWGCQRYRCPGLMCWTCWDILLWMSPERCCNSCPPCSCALLLVRLDLENRGGGCQGMYAVGDPA